MDTLQQDQCSGLEDDERLARSVQLDEDLKFAIMVQQKQVRPPRRRANQAKHKDTTSAASTTTADDATATTTTHIQAARSTNSVHSTNPSATGERSRPVALATRKKKSTRRHEEAVNKEDSLAAAMNDGLSFSRSNRGLLYVLCEINDRLVEMMVDTGAQTSVISATLMKKLSLDDKLNRNHVGVARGVGTAKIIGRVENCPVRIHHVEFKMFLSCLEVDRDILILGIDQMKRFRCLIDLEGNKLIFGGQGGVEVQLLE